MLRDKKLITGAFVAAFLFCYLHCQAQEPFLKQLHDYKQHLKEQIIKLSQTDTFLQKALSKMNNFVILPFCKFKGNYILSSAADHTLNLLELDTTFATFTYDIFLTNHTLYVTPTYKQVEGHRFNRVWQVDSGYRQVSMCLFGREHSDDLFSIGILPRETIGANPFAFIDKNELHILGFYYNEPKKEDEYTIYKNVYAYLIHHYGSIEKYAELAQEDIMRKEVTKKLSSIDECKMILRSSYSLWAEHYPNDTAHILDLFFAEIDSLAKLSPSQLAFLNPKIAERIKEQFTPGIVQNRPTWFDYCMSGNFTLMESDISDIVASVLTDEQFLQYSKKLKLLLWQRRHAFLKLEGYYIPRLRDVTEKEEDAIFNKEVFYARVP